MLAPRGEDFRNNYIAGQPPHGDSTCAGQGASELDRARQCRVLIMHVNCSAPLSPRVRRRAPPACSPFAFSVSSVVYDGRLSMGRDLGFTGDL